MSAQSRAASLRGIPTSTASRFGKVSLRLDSVALDDPPEPRGDYFPAGSMSSHRDSDSDEDLSHPAPSLIQPKLSPDAAGFKPTSDNVIVFEVYTPTSEEEVPKEFSFPQATNERECYVISEEVSDSRGIASSPDLLCSEGSGYSSDEDDLEKAETSSRDGLQAEVLKLQQEISQQKGEIKGLKMLLQERDATLTHLHRGLSAEVRDRGTMTSQLEESKQIGALSQKVEQLTASCRRYERQNQELRREIQSNVNDIMELDKAKTKLISDLKKASIAVDTYESELGRFSEFIDSLLQHTDDELFWAQADRDPKHLSNYVFSKVEIFASRYTRMQAAYDNLAEDNARLRQELEMRVKNAQTQASDHMDLVKQLNTRIKLKDRFIIKLESTLKIYKEKLLELRDEDFHRGSAGDSFAMMAPSHRTENLSHRLKSIVEDLKPFRSHDGSPLLEDTAQSVSPLKEPPRKAKGLTEKSFIESDEDVLRPTYMSGSESLNNTLDAVQRKPETPLTLKRQGWKAKHDRRNVHHRTQSQNLFALENYQPVLLNRTAGKELTLRGRDAKAPVTARQESTLTKPIKSDNLTPKSSKPPPDPKPKSQSLDRKRPLKDSDSKPRPKPRFLR